MAARPISASWPLAGEMVMASSESQAVMRRADEEGVSDTSSIADVDSKNNTVVGTTELYENGQIRLIPVSGCLSADIDSC